MTCNACGEKPKNTAKDFTKAVIEINNHETLVLLRKVTIPASMGTEEDVPASIGKYHNVILHYEANKHTYLYSSDGIPTLLEADVPQEILDKIDLLEDGLEQEITMREGADDDLQSNIDAVAQDLEDLKNSPDVVDIVPTYAALQAYDTSKLGDNDEIRVLTDETHDGASSYYRWDKENNQWEFIGITGPYYTKNEIDATVQSIDSDIDDLQSEIGKAKILTQEDYNYPADNPNSIALWLLDPGMYIVSPGVSARVSNSSVAEDALYIVSALGTHGKAILNLSAYDNQQTGPYYGYIYTVSSAGAEFDNRPLNSIIDALDSTYTKRALSANQGKVLNEKIGDLAALTTTNKTNTVAAINEIVSGLPTVVQTTGTSTTDVMSQNAVTSMVYNDPGTNKNVVIGGGTVGSATDPVAIGRAASVRGNYAIAIGSASGSQVANAPGSVSLGAFSLAGTQGQMDISLASATSQAKAANGYAGSGYRLLTGLYDPQNAHDAANKEYVDSLIAALDARIAALENS